MRSGEAESFQGNGLFYQVLSSQGDLANLHPLHVTVPLQRQETRSYQHDGEEWLYVLSGHLRLVLDNKEYTLQPHDAAHFDARISHHLEALGEQDIEILVVSCAAFASLQSLTNLATSSTESETTVFMLYVLSLTSKVELYLCSKQPGLRNFIS